MDFSDFENYKATGLITRNAIAFTAFAAANCSEQR
jgi:hypothetical protein